MERKKDEKIVLELREKIEDLLKEYSEDPDAVDAYLSAKKEVIESGAPIYQVESRSSNYVHPYYRHLPENDYNMGELHRESGRLLHNYEGAAENFYGGFDDKKFHEEHPEALRDGERDSKRLGERVDDALEGYKIYPDRWPRSESEMDPEFTLYHYRKRAEEFIESFRKTKEEKSAHERAIAEKKIADMQDELDAKRKELDES